MRSDQSYYNNKDMIRISCYLQRRRLSRRRCYRHESERQRYEACTQQEYFLQSFSSSG